MRRLTKVTLFVLGTLVLSNTAWAAWHDKPPMLDQFLPLMLPAAPAHKDGLQVTFLGVSTILFDDGETQILTDGFFTRPGRVAVVTGKICSNPVIVRKSLTHAGINRLAAVVVSHSHYDHAMDAPEVAKQTGAALVGSESTANIGRGAGVPKDRIKVVRSGDSLEFGKFKITFVATEHVPTIFKGGEITEPLVPPVHAIRYKEGATFSIFVENGGRSVLVQSSAGFTKGALDGKKAGVVFLGVGRLVKQPPAYQQEYWKHVVQEVGARRVIPIHWDDFTRPLTEPLVAVPKPIDDFEKAMEFLVANGKRDDVEVRLAPVWIPVDPFAGI